MDYFDNMDDEKSFDDRHRRDPGFEQITNCNPLGNLASHTFQSSIYRAVDLLHISHFQSAIEQLVQFSLLLLY